MEILRTNRLRLRELDPDRDAAFVCELLNTPKFLQYIGDRGVRTREDAFAFIRDKYAKSYRDHGYGLYAVDLAADETPVGICGFVKRPVFDHADIGFAFLPDHERKGYGFESAAAVLKYGREDLHFTKVLAITSQNNDASSKLLEKLGFRFDKLFALSDDDDPVKLYSLELSEMQRLG